MNKFVKVLLRLLLPVLLAPAVKSLATFCQNGGTFDVVSFRCICTPDFYGTNCETSFFSSDPCSNPSIPVLNDPSGNHAPSNNQSCSASGGCIDFSRTPTGWYRLRSPAGGSLTSTCPSSTTSCGSSYPYMLTNVVQEANANRRLHSARLSRVTGTAPTCYSTTETPYRVRILGCGSFNLYFLEPTMSTSHHYCIGDKQPCSSGLVSADGSGFEPCYSASSCMPRLKSGAALPVLRQTNNDLNSSHFESVFNCSFQDTFASNFTQGVLYKVMYRLTFQNSTRITVPGCTFSNLTVSSGGTITVSCQHEKILMPRSNIYGGALECVLQAKCNSEAGDYISQELTSLPHRFSFQFGLIDSKTNSTTSELSQASPIQLCANISKVPIIGDVTFRTTVSHHASVPSDVFKIERKFPAVNESSSCTDACFITIRGMYVQYAVSCFELQLATPIINPSQVEVSASFSSSADRGIYTAGEWVKFISHVLTVNNGSLTTLSRTALDSSTTVAALIPTGSSVITFNNSFSCLTVSLLGLAYFYAFSARYC